MFADASLRMTGLCEKRVFPYLFANATGCAATELLAALACIEGLVRFSVSADAVIDRLDAAAPGANCAKA